MRGLPAAVLLLAALSLHAQAGLLDQPQTFPWSVGLTPVVQEEAGGLGAGGLRLKTSTLWFNTYRRVGIEVEDMTQLVDMEGLLQTTSGAWSFAPGWELRGQVQGWVLGGGVMDFLVSGFHWALGLPNQGRDRDADGRYRDYVKGLFDRRDAPAGLTQASAGVRAFSGPWSWSAWVKPPLPAPVDWGWTDCWSAGSSVAWGESWNFSGTLVGGGATLALLGAPVEKDFPTSRAEVVPQFGVYGTVATPWNFRLLTQASWTRVPRTGTGYLGQGAGLLTVGAQVPVKPEWTVELGLTEEFLTWATMEVGFQAGLAWNL